MGHGSLFGFAALMVSGWLSVFMVGVVDVLISGGERLGGGYI